jgi:hypothetical protein
MDKNDIINELKALIHRIEQDSTRAVMDVKFLRLQYETKLGVNYDSQRSDYMNYKHALRLIAHHDLGFKPAQISRIEFEIFGEFPHHTTIGNSLKKGEDPDVRRTITELRRGAVQHLY